MFLDIYNGMFGLGEPWKEGNVNNPRATREEEQSGLPMFLRIDPSQSRLYHFLFDFVLCYVVIFWDSELKS